MKYLLAAGCVWVCLLIDPCPRFVNFCNPPTNKERLTAALPVRSLIMQQPRHAQISANQWTSQDRYRSSDFEQN